MLARRLAPQMSENGSLVLFSGVNAFKVAYLKKQAAENPAGRVGTPGDIASAVLFAMTNSFLTGVTLKVDDGEPLT